MHISENGNTLTVFLTGELDHHASKPLREETDAALLRCRPKTLLLDFSGVTFMDSSGVGFVMGRYKKAAELGCRTAVRGLNAHDERIMRLSGLPQLVEFRAKTDAKTEATDRKELYV